MSPFPDQALSSQSGGWAKDDGNRLWGGGCIRAAPPKEDCFWTEWPQQIHENKFRLLFPEMYSTFKYLKAHNKNFLSFKLHSNSPQL